MNKFIQKIVIVIVIIIVAILAFYLWNRSKTVGLKVKTNSQDQFLFPTTTSDATHLIFFNNLDEPAFYKTDLNGLNKEIISGRLDTPDNVVYSPDRNYALLQVKYNKDLFEQYDSVYKRTDAQDQEIAYYNYDFANQKIYPLDLNIRDAVFATDSKKIIAAYYNGDTFVNNVYSFDLNGKNGKNIYSPDFSVEKIVYYDSASKSLIFGTPSPKQDETENKVDLNILKNGETSLIIEGVNATSIYPNSTGDKIVVLQDIAIKLIDQLEVKTLVARSEKLNAGWNNNQLAFISRSPNTVNDDIYNYQDKKLTKITIPKNISGISGLFWSDNSLMIFSSANNLTVLSPTK